MKQIFDFLRKISGGKLTQKQVKAADKLIATAYDDVTGMLGRAGRSVTRTGSPVTSWWRCTGSP